jgi:ERCC4-type nuclease
MKHYYTDKKYKDLISHMVILHDSREQTSNHILEYFDKHNIKHEKRALKTGDYSFKIEACPELGYLIDTYFTDELCIERKNGINEIAGNISEKDDRFLKEINRMINIQDCYILIEDDRIDGIIEHNYDTKLNELSLLRTLLTIQKRSNFYPNFVKKENMGKMIYEICLSSLNSKILK